MELTANARYLAYQASLNQVKGGAQQVGANPTVQKPTEAQAPSTPSESVTFTSSTPLKTPRSGGDMWQMVEDMQANGLVPTPQPETVSPETFKPALKEPTNDFMAQMVESIQNDQARGGKSVHVHLNNNGAIAMLDDQGYLGLDTRSGEPLAFYQDGKTIKGNHEHDSKAHGHGHGSGLKEDGLLGGHIGTEVIEKIGHEAHHAVTHAATHGTTHAATQTGAHAAVQATAENGHHLSGVAQHGAVETAAESSDMATAGVSNLGKEAAHHLSTGMEIALGVGTIGAGVLAVPLTYNGIKELKHGIKEKNTEKILEGVGGIAVGTRSAATAAVMGGMLTTSEVVGQIAHAASSTLTPLGLIHATADVFMGGMDIAKGKSTQGWLKVTSGVAIGAAAVVGGLPLTLVALGALGAKVGHKLYTGHQAKKAAAQHEQPQEQTPTVQLPAVNGFTPAQQFVPTPSTGETKT